MLACYQPLQSMATSPVMFTEAECIKTSFTSLSQNPSFLNVTGFLGPNRSLSWIMQEYITATYSSVIKYKMLILL